MTSDESAPEILDELIHRGESCGASDIHLQMIGRKAEVSFRLDGVMAPASSLSDDVADRVFGRINPYQQSR